MIPMIVGCKSCQSAVSLTEYHSSDLLFELLDFDFIGGITILPNSLFKTIPFLLFGFEAILHEAGEKSASTHSRALGSGVNVRQYFVR
jgi:hypothetical protein